MKTLLLLFLMSPPIQIWGWQGSLGPLEGQPVPTLGKSPGDETPANIPVSWPLCSIILTSQQRLPPARPLRQVTEVSPPPLCLQPRGFYTVPPPCEKRLSLAAGEEQPWRWEAAPGLEVCLGCAMPAVPAELGWRFARSRQLHLPWFFSCCRPEHGGSGAIGLERLKEPAGIGACSGSVTRRWISQRLCAVQPSVCRRRWVSLATPGTHD